MKPRLYLALLVSFLALAIVAYFERDPLLAVAAWAWVVDETPQPADAILILAGGPTTRPQSAVRLYQAGWAPRILITKTVNPGLSGREGRNVRAQYEQTTALLLDAGVPSEAIELVGSNVDSTWDEAEAVKAWVKSTGVRRLIITTDALHTRRVRWLFHHELDPEHVELTIVSAQPRDTVITPAWPSDDAQIYFKKEIIKYVYYRVKY